jgi:hypothetical protein
VLALVLVVDDEVEAEPDDDAEVDVVPALPVLASPVVAAPVEEAVTVEPGAPPKPPEPMPPPTPSSSSVPVAHAIATTLTRGRITAHERKRSTRIEHPDRMVRPRTTADPASSCGEPRSEVESAPETG